MWIPLQIKIVNFASISSLHFRFERGVSRLIQGINECDDGQQSNGAGKSLPLDAIAICLTGDTFRDLRLVELIRDGCDFFDLELDLYNSLLKKFLRIKTKVFSSNSKPQTYTLWLTDNEEDLGEEKFEIKLSSVDEKKKKILQLLEISKEDLLNFYLVHKDTYTSFFSSSDSKKKEVVNRFSGGYLINNVEKEVESELKDINSEIQAFEKEIEFLCGKKSVLEEDINKLQNFNEEELKEQEIQKQFELITRSEQKIKIYKEDIENFTLDLNNKSKLIAPLNKKIEEAKTKLTNFESKDFLSELSTLNFKRKEQLKLREELFKQEKEIKAELNEIEKYLASIRKNLAGTVECPKCNHKFLTTDKGFNVEEAEKQLPELNNMVKEVNEGLKNKEEAILNQEKIVGEIDAEKREIDRLINENSKQKIELSNQISNLNKEKIDLESKIQFIEKSISSLHDSIENGKKYISELNKTIDEIRNREATDKSGEINSKKLEVEIINSNILEKRKNVEDKKEELFNTNAWVFNFKKFKSHLANQSIKTIEGYTNLFLQKIKSNLQIEVEGFKILADGKTMREEIGINVLRNGLPTGSFGRFSSGERARMIIASIAALQKIINSNCKSGGFGYLALDEVIESVDGKGIQSIVKEFSEIYLTIDIITHGYHNIQGVNTITMLKKNGVTNIA